MIANVPGIEDSEELRVPIAMGNHNEEARAVCVKHCYDICREAIKVCQVLHDRLGISKGNGSIGLEYHGEANPVGSPGIANMLVL